MAKKTTDTIMSKIALNDEIAQPLIPLAPLLQPRIALNIAPITALISGLTGVFQASCRVSC
ncbi:MAG TPA: hypothetical protein DIW64_11940 [Cellvibrio sp.]|nr:hypothetical protein [Cellvibrio sp.]